MNHILSKPLSTKYSRHHWIQIYIFRTEQSKELRTYQNFPSVPKTYLVHQAETEAGPLLHGGSNVVQLSQIINDTRIQYSSMRVVVQYLPPDHALGVSLRSKGSVAGAFLRLFNWSARRASIWIILQPFRSSAFTPRGCSFGFVRFTTVNRGAYGTN